MALQEIASLVLASGENQTRGLVVSSSLQKVYVSLWSSPGKIVRIDIPTFAEDATYTGENYFYMAALDETNGFLYAVTYTAPAQLVKITLSTMVKSGTTLTLNANEDYGTTIFVDPVGKFAYVGCNVNPGKVVKCDVSGSPTRVGVVTLAAGETGVFVGAIDATNKLAYVGCNTAPCKVVKLDVDPANTFAALSTITMNTDENWPGYALVDLPNGLLYICTTTVPGRVMKIDINPAHTFARLDGMVMPTTNLQQLFGGGIDLVNKRLYWVTSAGLYPYRSSNIPNTGGGGVCIKIVGNYLYRCGGKVIEIMDLTNQPWNMLWHTMSVGTHTSSYTSSTYNALDVSGNYAYIGCRYGTSLWGLRIYDISTPSAPTIVSSLSVGSVVPYDVSVDGNYVYLTNYTGDTFYVIDVTTKASPTIVGTLSLGASSGPIGVTFIGNYAYVCCYTSHQIKTIDVTTKASPSVVNTITITSGSPYYIEKLGTDLYVADYGNNTMVILDTSSTPAAPTITSTTSMDGSATLPSHILPIVDDCGSYAVAVCTGTKELQYFDISNKASPVFRNKGPVDYSSNTGYRAATDGTWIYLQNFNSAFVHTYNVPTLASAIQMDTDTFGVVSTLVMPPSYTFLEGGDIDSVNQVFYSGTADHPARIVKMYASPIPPASYKNINQTVKRTSFY